MRYPNFAGAVFVESRACLSADTWSTSMIINWKEQVGIEEQEKELIGGALNGDRDTDRSWL